MTDWHDLAETVQAFATAGAIAIGGTFTYYKFIKDRVYRPRLSLKIETSRRILNAKPFIHCTLSIENRGTPKVKLVPKGSTVMIQRSALDHSDSAQYAVVTWDKAATIRVFSHHEWIESNETIATQILVAIDPARRSAPHQVRMDITVDHPHPLRRKKIVITAAAIDFWPEEPEAHSLTRRNRA
ncbi:MAG TPA: hypothetical protein VHC49_26970 [Mycobacteriales bacterium]|nr:hypothetical protein [Mycobacteriales bacterium]